MKGFIPLFRLSFQSLLLTSMNSGAGRGKRRGRAVSGTSAMLLLCAVMVFISGTYSFTLSGAFAPLGGLDIMLLYMVLIATFFPVIFTIYGAQGIVYSTKDIDLVMSLPVSPFSVMLARLSALYLEALMMCELMLVPAGAAYMYYGGADGIGVILRLVILGLFLAILPTLISLILGGIVSLLVARTRFKNGLNTLFSLVLMVGMFALIFSFNSTISATESAGFSLDAMRATFTGALPPLGWAVQAVLGNWLLLLLICAGCLVPFLLVTWLFSKFYKRMLTAMSSHYLRTDYKLRGLKARGSFKALFYKEAKKFFGTPAFVLNSGISVLILVVASVAAVIFRGAIQQFLGALALGGAAELVDIYLPLIILGVLLFFGAMTFISCVSISLEGKTLWILKEAPLSVGKIFTAKAGFNFVVAAFTALVCIPLLAYAFSFSPLTAVAMAVVALLFSLLTSAAGLFINLLFPRMDAENDAVVIKQSSSVMVSMLFGALMLGLLIALFFLMKHFGLGFDLFAAAAAVLLAGLCALCFTLLNTTGRKLFAQL